MPPDTMRAVLIVLALFVVAQGAVIAWLLVQRARRERAARTLRNSQERFRLIADRAPVIIWTSTPQGMLDYINSTAAEFTGLSVDQLLKDGWHTAVHPDDMDGCLRTYLPAVEERRPFLMEFRARKGDGTYGWLLASGVPKYAPDGVYVGQIGASIEITDRKLSEEALRESQQRLTMATAAGAVGVWDWNFVTNQLFVDSRLKSLLGFDDAEIEHPSRGLGLACALRGPGQRCGTGASLCRRPVRRLRAGAPDAAQERQRQMAPLSAARPCEPRMACCSGWSEPRWTSPSASARRSSSASRSRQRRPG